MEMTKDEALLRAARYCVGAERCCSDIRRKLWQWQVDEALHEEIIAYLLAEKYVDEERYCAAFVHDKSSLALWGTRRIHHELRAKQIPERTIQAALRELEEECEPSDQLLTLLSRKFRTLPDSLEWRKAYERLVRYGLYRGYEYDDIAPIAKSLLKERGE